MDYIANVTKSFVYLTAQFHAMKKNRNIISISFMNACPYKRHYHSDLSIWLSVDPMSDKYPSMSPYTYCANNPVKLVDPDGRDTKTQVAVFTSPSANVVFTPSSQQIAPFASVLIRLQPATSTFGKVGSTSGSGSMGSFSHPIITAIVKAANNNIKNGFFFIMQLF